MSRGFSSLHGQVSPCGGFSWCQGFPGDAVVRNPPANAGESIPGLCYCVASHNETESVPCGVFQAVPVGSKLFLCPVFLFVGNSFIQDPWPSKSSKGQILLTVGYQWRERMHIQGKSSEEKNSASLGQHAIPLGVYRTIHLQRTKVCVSWLVMDSLRPHGL